MLYLQETPNEHASVFPVIESHIRRYGADDTLRPLIIHTCVMCRRRTVGVFPWKKGPPPRQLMLKIIEYPKNNNNNIMPNLNNWIMVLRAGGIFHGRNKWMNVSSHNNNFYSIICKGLKCKIHWRADMLKDFV